MDLIAFNKLKRAKAKHTPEVSKQTGFPSPATHYLEHTIDLHEHLIKNTDATFFVRIDGDGLSGFNIHNNDVLIIDRSLAPKENGLVLAVEEGEFKVKRFSKRPSEPYTIWGIITYIIHAVS
jgi:DNA polymerase V